MSETTPKKSDGPSTVPDPSRLLQIGMGFWASKVLLTAVNKGLFTLLAESSRTGKAIKETLSLQTTDRHVYDWLDALTSLGFLQRDGLMKDAVYRNSPESEVFLDKRKPSYIGGLLQMANNRLYAIWGELEEALVTGKPQNESKLTGNMDFFMEMYKDERKLQEFIDAMSSIQKGNFTKLVREFNFGQYKSIADIGGADASLCIQICLNHPDIQCISFDLPPVAPLAEEKINEFKLGDRIRVVSGDLMTDLFPQADVISMGNILHGLDEETKISMIKKVYAALSSDGAFIAIENIIDNDRRENTFGLLMSLNMLLENGDGFDYTFDDFRQWTTNSGFKKQQLVTLTGPASAAIAYK